MFFWGAKTCSRASLVRAELWLKPVGGRRAGERLVYSPAGGVTTLRGIVAYPSRAEGVFRLAVRVSVIPDFVDQGHECVLHHMNCLTVLVRQFSVKLVVLNKQS